MTLIRFLADPQSTSGQDREHVQAHALPLGEDALLMLHVAFPVQIHTV